MSEAVLCKQCGVTDNQQAKCDSCDQMFPHAELIHYDYVGVFCIECDEFVEEQTEEEAP